MKSGKCVVSRHVFILLAGLVALPRAAGAEAIPCYSPDPLSPWTQQSFDQYRNEVLRVLGVTFPADHPLRKIAQADSVVKAVGFYDQPTSRTCSSVSYRIPDQVLKPGEALYFDVPESMRSRPVAFVTLGHRQDPSQQTGTTPGQKWDSAPGTTSFQVFTGTLENGDWHYWRGDASGAQGAKFAEVSHSPERENLYEWRKYGHTGIRSGISSTDPLPPRALRLVSNGSDPVVVSELTLKVAPLKASHHQNVVFSEGTDLGDPETAAGRRYGGGQAHGGRFPGALVLGGHGSGGSTAKLPEGWEVRGGSLHIKLKPGTRLSSVDIAGGDSHPDGITNSDGGWGTKGWARMSVGLVRKDGGTDWMMRGENVPPEGVLHATPTDCDYQVQEGDELVISGESDLLYVMAVRLGTIEK